MFNVPNLRRSAIPLYTQIASSLRNEIESGTWPVGSKLPAMNQLADRFGVATQTMRQALGLLATSIGSRDRADHLAQEEVGI